MPLLRGPDDDRRHRWGRRTTAGTRQNNGRGVGSGRNPGKKGGLGGSAATPIAFVAISSAHAISSASTQTQPTIPTADIGDLAICFGLGRVNVTTVSISSGPSGWTSLGQRKDSSNGIMVAAYYKFLVGGDSNPVITWSGHSTAISGVVIYTPANATQPDVAVVGSSLDGAGGTTWTPTGLTTSTSGAMVLSLVGTFFDKRLTMQTAQGFTARADGAAWSSTLGGDACTALAEKLVTPAGAVTCPTWQMNNTPVAMPWAGMTIALRPT